MIPAIQLLILVIGFDHRFWGGQEGLLSFSLAEMVTYPVLCLILLDWARKLFFEPKSLFETAGRVPRTFQIYLLWIPVAALTGWLLYANSDGLHSLKDCMPGIVLYLALVTWVRTEQHYDSVVRGIFVTLALLSLLGFSQFLFGGPHINPVADNAFSKFALTGDARVSRPVVGPFGTPNAFAVLLAPLFVTCGAHFLFEKVSTTTRERASVVALLTMVGVAIVLIQAKAVLAVTAFATAATIVAGRRFNAGKRVPMGGMLIAGIVVAALGIAAILIQEANLPEGLGLGTMRGRLLLAGEAIVLLRDYASVAFVGGGVDLFVAVVPTTFHVHTEYLLQALMWGIPGAILFITVLLNSLLEERSRIWAPRFGLLCLSLIFLFESAGGSQRQATMFLVFGLTHAAAIPGRSHSAV